MSGDQILATARYQAGDGDAVQAFPLGGFVNSATLSNQTPAALTSAQLKPACSIFVMDIPAGATVYVGRLDQLAGAVGAAAKALMMPIPGGVQRTFVLTDQHQPNVAWMADPSGQPVTVTILEAGSIGGAA